MNPHFQQMPHSSAWISCSIPLSSPVRPPLDDDGGLAQIKRSIFPLSKPRSAFSNQNKTHKEKSMKKKTLPLIVLIIALLAAGCAAQAPAEPAPVEPEAAVTEEAAAPEKAPAVEAPVQTEAPAETPAIEEPPAAEPAPGSFSVTDALDRTVTFESAPQRIALGGKANLLVADALYFFPEAVDRIGVLGRSNQGTGNFLAVVDPNFDSKPAFDTDVGPEQLVSEKPDAVVLKSYLAESLGAPLEAVGIPVIYVDFETPEQYTRDLKTIGQLFQNETRAAEVSEFYSARVASIQDKVSGLTDEQKPRVLLLYYSDKDGEVAFNVPPMSWMQTILVETAGGSPVWKDANLGKGWTKVTLEQIAAWDADQIFIISYFKPVAEVLEILKADPQWQLLRAVTDGQLYGFAGDMLSWDQADTRWILGLDWLATKIHPDLFADLDIMVAAQTFFTELYGMSEETFQSEIVPFFNGDLP